MSVSNLNYTASKTTHFFSKVNKFWSIAGLHDLWVVDAYNDKIYKFIHKMITYSIFIFIFLEILALFTQTNLTDKQSSDLVMFSFCHPIILSYYLGIVYHKKRVKELLIMLHITLKEVYNNPDVEKRMIKKATFFAITYLFCISVSLICYGFDGLMQVLRPDGSFITVVTAWPDVKDKSFLANLVRVIYYLFWWIFAIRISSASVLTIMTSVALSHQYRNIQSYFHSLNDLFQEDADEKSYKDSELRYLEALKVGIRQHSLTLWCTKQYQVTGTLVVSGQIIINVSVLCLLMSQMAGAERTLENALTIICTIIAILTGTGLFMLNAGEITYEASLVPTAMYSSGWENCRSTASAKARRLLVVAMMQGQKHVALRSFGIIEISYESYVSIVKASYSMFSLLY